MGNQSAECGDWEIHTFVTASGFSVMNASPSVTVIDSVSFQAILGVVSAELYD